MSALETVRGPIARAGQFLEECLSELKRVHFPSRKETQAATLVVIVSVTVVGLYLGVVDVVLSWVIHRVLH
jgi:preprotein translocase subunit SecE